MTFKKTTRALAGLSTVVTLLVLIAADTLYSGITLSVEDKLILVSLVSALLGIDIALSELPISFNTDRNGTRESGGRDDTDE